MPSIATRTFPAGAAVAAMTAAYSPAPRAQEPVDADGVAAIIADARERSGAAELFHTLTDVPGPRPAGSPRARRERRRVRRRRHRGRNHR